MRQDVRVMHRRLIVESSVIITDNRIDSSWPEFRRNGRSAVAALATGQLNQLSDTVSRCQMFGNEIGWIDQPVDFPQLNSSRSSPFLQPQRMGLYMAQFAKSRSPTYPDSCDGICSYSDSGCHAHVCHKRLVPQCYTCGCNHTTIFSLP